MGWSANVGRLNVMVAAMVVGAGLGRTVSAEPVTLPESWTSALSWRSIGPANMSGRIVGLAVYEADPTIWWAATASGGLLKTTNDGLTFTHQFDHESTVSIGAVAVSASNPDIVWVGTGESNPRNSVSWGDGAYKSVDGGATWTNMGLRESFQIGAVVIHPTDPDIVYVGALGRLWGPNAERGLYKTVDGGTTWEKILDVDESTGVIDVDMHPTDPDTLLVATYERARDLFDTNDPAKRWGPGGGLYKTTDGGATFDRITDGLPTGQIGRIGLDYSRANPDIVYALVEVERIGGEPENAPHAGLRGEDAEVGARITAVTEGGPAARAGLQVGDIVIRLNDDAVLSYAGFVRAMRQHEAGDTVELTVSRNRESVVLTLTFDGRPEAEEDQEVGGRGGGGGGGAAAASAPFGTRLGGQQANMQDQQGKAGAEFGGVYRSEDGGDSWTRVNSLNPRPMYFSEIRVDPSDDQYVYVLGIPLFKSKDGGKTFTDDGHQGKNGAAHVDHHALWVDPNDGRHIILGNDGGVYVTRDRMENWDHLNHVAIGQFYHVATDSRENYRVYGGLQDNGSWGGPSRSDHDSGPINEDWFRVGGGDGFICLVDAQDPDLVYFESQNGGMGRINLRTGERGFIRPQGARGVRYRFNWKTPYHLSHHNSRIFYAAGNVVFRSLDRGNNLRPISPEITATDKGAATAFGESPRDPDVLYVGTDDGALWATRDGGHAWHDLFEPAADEPAPAGAARAGGRPNLGTNAGPGGGRRGGAGGGRGGAGRMTEMLRSADANGDGIITRDEMPERLPEQLFDRLDADGSGGIDAEELANAASRLGGGGAGGPGGGGAGGATRGGRGGAGGAPTRAAPAAAETPESTGFGALILRAIRAADKNGDGRIQRDELPERLHVTFDRLDTDKDGELSEAELAAAGGGAAAVSKPAARSTAPAAPATADQDPVAGTWAGKIIGMEMPEAQATFTLRLTRGEDGRYTGTLETGMGTSEISNGRYDAESRRLTMQATRDDFESEIVVTITDAEMAGEIRISGANMTIAIEATRNAAAAESTDAAEPAGPPISELLPTRMHVSAIEPSRFADGRVYVAFDGHRSNVDRPYVATSDDYGRSWRLITADLPDGVGSARVIREDRTNGDLLYLGTEFGLWASIDRGESWARLHGNLPTVAVHEVAQHPTVDDIVVGTHGRSIWILDVSAVRQMNAKALAADVHLFEPRDAVYWSSSTAGTGSTMRRFVGQNPDDRAAIVYALKSRSDRVRLRVLDQAGEIVRDLGDVSGDAGLHEVRWDLRREPRQGQSQQRRFRGGPRVDPGTYVVELTVGNTRITQPLVVRNDPDRPDARQFGEAYDDLLDAIAALEEDDAGDDRDGRDRD